MKKVLLFVAVLAFSISLTAQKSPSKFGKPEKVHLESTVCPIDSGAAAYVIFDFANSFFTFNPSVGFAWTRERHYRIKILKSSAYDEANISIPIYQSSNGKEYVAGLKAATYNMENGEVEKYKIRQQDAFIEETTDNWKQFKFALPNVKEGSVIEVSYKLVSEFPSYLRDWHFQRDIPVLHSEIYLNIPEFFVYHENMKGYHQLADIDRSVEYGKISLNVRTSPHSPLRYSRTQTIDFRENVKHFTAKNLPALKSEAYVDNMDNYRSMIEFELERIKIGNDITNFTTDWDAVTVRLLEADYFGYKLNKTGFARDDIKSLTEKYSDKTELMNAIYQHVQQNVKWNGKTGFSPRYDLREAYIEGQGSASIINFILINMLRKAGLEVYPLALSTRKNGWILPTYPTMDKFNHVIGYCIIGENSYLLDASDQYCPPGVLPPRCLNGKGRIIDHDNKSWVDIRPDTSYAVRLMYDVSIDPTGMISGKLNMENKGYAAIGFRHYRDDFNDEEKMIEDLEEEHPGMLIKDYNITGLDQNYGPVSCEFMIDIENKSEFMGDMITLNPLFFERTEENPFKLDERKFPINYTYPRSYQYMFKIKIPEGYEVESIPEAVNLIMPDKSCSFLYNSVQFGDTINITVMFNIRRDVYQSAEYTNLKEFYNYLVAKESELIVLKKKS